MVNDIRGFLEGVKICNLTSHGFCVVFPVMRSKNLKLPSGVVFECLNALFEYDYLTYFLLLKSLKVVKLLLLTLATHAFLLSLSLGKPHMCTPFSERSEHPHAAQHNHGQD